MKSKRNLYLLALGVFGITTTEFGVIGILPDLARAFQVSIEKAGWLLSSFALIVALFGPLMVSITAFISRKKLLLFTLLLFVICNILSALVNSFYQLLIIRMLPAFFHPVFWSIALSIAEKTSKPEGKSKAVGIIFLGLTTATVVGVPIAAFVSGLINWEASFFITGLLNLIALILLQIFLPSTEDAKMPPGVYSKKKVLSRGLLWINILLAFSIITAMFSTYGYMADFLRSVTLMSISEISLMLLLFGLVGIIGNHLAGNLMSRYPYGTTMSFIILLTAVHVSLSIFGDSFIPMVFIVSCWGLVHSGGFLISNMSVTSSSSDSPEFINSLFTSCGNFGVTAGALLGGQIIALYGIQNVVWASVGCLMVSFVILITKKMVYK